MKTVSYHKHFFLSVAFVTAVADLDGFLEVSIEPPLRQNYFIFMENFQKNLEKLINIINQVKLTNQTPFVKLNPLSRNPGSGSTPGLVFKHPTNSTSKVIWGWDMMA